MKKMFPLLCCAAFLFSCKQKDYTVYTNDPMLYCKTVKKLNDVVLFNNFSPVVASRNYAYANIAAYECIVAGDNNYRSLSGQIKQLPQMPKPSEPGKTDFHLAALLSFIKVGNSVTFPEGVLIDYYNELKAGAKKAGMPSSVLNSTVAFSDAISAAILNWSKDDNYTKTRSAEKYVVIMEDSRWIPTPPAYTPALEPHWCDIRTLALDSCSQFLPVSPPVYNMKDSTSKFCRELMEVKTVGDHLTAEQKEIADFFDDNPFKVNAVGHLNYVTKKFSPPGHWMNVVGIAAQKSKMDFNGTVAAYTATSIALFDGFIACWKSKFMSNTVRPETVINRTIDPNWQPYIQTPPFPGYVSGHSVISSASAEVMTHFFGDHFQYTDTSGKEFGIPARSFKSFREAALEASWSRLYGGIHYRSDLEQGNLLGTTIGQYIVGKLQFNKNENQLSSIQ
jgi:hypothetical protein